MATSLARRSSMGLVIGVTAAVLAWCGGTFPFVETIELKTYDLRVRSLTDPAEASPDILIVTIDDGSVRKMEPLVGRWPWPRLAHGTVVDYLTRAGARVVVYDILFGERDRRTFTVQGDAWTGEESDTAFADAVARAGNVIVAADVTASDPLAAATSGDTRAVLDRVTLPASPVYETRPGIILPFAELAKAAAGVGHTFLVLDPDGPARRAVPAVRAGERAVPSLPLAAALHVAKTPPAAVHGDAAQLRVGTMRVPLVGAQVADATGQPTTASRMLIRFTGPAFDAEGRDTYREFSFYDLFYSELQLQAGERPFVDPAVFRNKVVLIGTTAAGLHDVFTVPFARGKMPGVQIHANVLDDLLQRRFMRQASPAAAVVLTVLFGCVVGVVVAAWGVWWALAAAAVLVLGGAAGAAVLFRDGVWVEVTRPVMGGALALFAGTAYQYFVEGREKRQVKQVFARYVSRDVFSELMADPTRARLGGHRRDMSVLFADIRGFTAFTERGHAEAVVGQLNEYFSAMVPVVFAHQGTVDKFVGDMIMALFGAPLDDPDHAEHAVQTALAMLDRLDTLNTTWRAEGKPELGIGVGINTGDMIAGNIGSDSIMSYTVIGDAVNLAARLESLNKDYGARIIISDATRRRLERRYDMKPLGRVTVKGKSEPVEIFEIRPGDASAEGADA